MVRSLPPSARNSRDLGLIPESGRSPGVGNDNLLQYSCLENPMDRGVWWATVCRAARSWTRLSEHTHIRFAFSQMNWASPGDSAEEGAKWTPAEQFENYHWNPGKKDLSWIRVGTWR